VTYEPLATGEAAGLWATPRDVVADRAVLYVFGGGHVITSVRARRKFGGHLALATRARVLVLDYPLAPEHPYPADVDAVAAGYRWLLAQGYPAAGIALAGESSAGGTVLSALLALGGAPRPAAAYLMSPWADLTCSGQSFGRCRDVDLECTRESLLRMAGQYLAGHDAADPAASPVFAPPARSPSARDAWRGALCAAGSPRCDWVAAGSPCCNSPGAGRPLAGTPCRPGTLS
jgi:acetyl esterase/lipase